MTELHESPLAIPPPPAPPLPVLPVLDMPLQTNVVAGQPSSAHAGQIIRWIETGVGLALSGAVGGLVTAPIAKAPLYAAGFKFPGHTEFLAELTAAHRVDGARGPVMLLQSQDLRCALVTIHTPLAAVSGELDIEKIVATGLVTAQALRQMNACLQANHFFRVALRKKPSLAVRRRARSSRSLPGVSGSAPTPDRFRPGPRPWRAGPGRLLPSTRSG